MTISGTLRDTTFPLAHGSGLTARCRFWHARFRILSQPNRPPGLHWRWDFGISIARNATATKKRLAMRSKRRSRRGRFGGRTCSLPPSYGTPIIVQSGSSRPSTRAAAGCKLDYVDCYLIHTPFAFRPGDDQDPRDDQGRVIYDSGVSLLETWQALERLVDDGHCKSIGLSDITLEKLQRDRCSCAYQTCRVQVESHPYLPEWDLLDFCRKHGIVRAGIRRVGTCLDAKPAGGPGDQSIAQDVAQDAGTSCVGMGCTAGYRLPDHLDQTSAHPGKF